MSTTMPADKAKKIMRIALIGVRPADQVMLKGYLRLLLNLETELEWVMANHQTIDLFMIHQELQHSDSVKRLSLAKPNASILFVNRSDSHGHLEANQLLLPLKDLEPLKNWLFNHVALLKNGRVGNVKKAASSEKTHQFIPQNVTNSFISTIQRLQKREDMLLTLKQDGNILAYIHPKRQRIWLVSANIRIHSDWQLVTTHDSRTKMPHSSLDLVQWLWEQAWQAPNHKELLSLVQSTTRYHLTSWVKPLNNHERHDILKIQCILDSKEVTIDELMKLAEVSYDMAVRSVSSLIVAGLMQPSIYTDLNSNLLMTASNLTNNNTLINLTNNQPTQTVNTPTNTHELNSQPDNTAMKSFLSRLREKLGL